MRAAGGVGSSLQAEVTVIAPAADAAPPAYSGTPVSAAGPMAGQPRVKWNTANLKSSYINFANASSTQEEIVLNFGVNTNWDRMGGEVEIELAHRIVMSPFAAKRLSELLEKLLAQYEGRYGKLK